MKRILCGFILISFVLPIFAYAGSLRLIMHFPIEAMRSQQYIHITFKDEQGNAIESGKLKDGKIAINGCDNKALRLGIDYRYGYYATTKSVGVFLPPEVWKNNKLCISLPDYQPLNEHFNDEQISHSLERILSII